MRRGALVVAVLTGVFPAVSARAQDHARAHLVYAAPDGCPDESAFRGHVLGQLGYDPFVDDQAPAEDVWVELTLAGELVRARMDVRSTGAQAPASRELSEAREHCAALVLTLANTLAMALDPLAASAAHPAPVAQPTPLPAPVHEPEPVLAEPTRPPVAPPAPVPAAPEPRPPTHGFAAVGPSVNVGLVPGVGVGGVAALGARYRLLALELEGRFDTSAKPVSVGDGHRVEASAISGGVLPCVHGSFYAGCLSMRLGVLQGRAPTVSHPSLGSSLLATTGLALRFELPERKGFRLRVDLHAALPLVRTELVINDQVAWTAAPVYAGLSLAAHVPLW